MIEKFEYSFQNIYNYLRSSNYFKVNDTFMHISTSSEEVLPNTLFIPLIGKRDGHQFIKMALEKGATGFIYERNNQFYEKLSSNEKQKGIEVKNTLHALGSLGMYHRLRFNPLVIAITGSSGKTTTKEIIGKAISYLGSDKIVLTEKNYNNEIGVPFTLFKINQNTKVVVLEMGMNHRYEISRMVKMAIPHGVMITNVGPCHIENLGSLKQIAKAKAEIIEGNKNIAVFIPENIVYKDIFKDKAKKYNNILYEFSLKENEKLKIESRDSMGFVLQVYGKSIPWKLPVPRILDNLAGVITLLDYFEFDKGGILDGFLKFEAGNNRNVVIDKGIKIIDDTYNANPDSMKSSIESLIQIAEKNDTIAILGDMKELGEFSKRYHKEVGFFASKTELGKIISFGNDSFFISNEYSKASGREAIHYKDEEGSIGKIVEFVLRNYKKNDVVLVKGSRGMKMERIVNELIRFLENNQ